MRVDGALPGARPGLHPDPLPGEDLWGDNAIATNSAVQPADVASDGDALVEADFNGAGKETNKEGLFALAKADLFNLLCIPGYVDTGAGFDVDPGLTTSAAAYCEKRRAMLLVDPPSGWLDKDQARGRPRRRDRDDEQKRRPLFPAPASAESDARQPEGRLRAVRRGRRRSSPAPTPTRRLEGARRHRSDARRVCPAFA